MGQEAKKRPRVAIPSAAAQLCAIVGVDVLHCSMASLLEKARSVSPNERKRVMLLLRRCFASQELGQDIETRIIVTRMYVAFFDESSLSFLKDLLAQRHGKRDFEKHFTLFCYLDWIEAVASQSIRRAVLSEVKKYLLSVRSDTASAAWMAADLLGDHWSLRTAVTELMEIARDAQYVAGRQAAVHGLMCALKRLHQRSSRGNQRLANGVVAILEEIARSDRSLRIRSIAQATLDEL